MITTLGDTFAGRMSASLLHAIGLPELIAGSLEEYEALALQLATDRQRLAALREKKLWRNRAHSPAFRYGVLAARHLECAYSMMWRRHQAGLAPDHIHVEA